MAVEFSKGVPLPKRCVNIDWLEVYCLESRDRFPCDADYFRRQGYFVQEREYGTRQYEQMFVIEDKQGEPFLEVRRKPCSGDSSFSGLVPESCHIRLVNRYCYFSNAVSLLRDFLSLHDYLFKRIFRIDICYDFTRFDFGDDPQKFLVRYLAKKYRKINQCKVTSRGDDNWTDFEWESLSWGSKSSMVSTKMYNKTKEMSPAGKDKPYIRYVWFLNGLVDNPVSLTKKCLDGQEQKQTIWRVEFSIKSPVDRWCVIEMQGGKRVKKKAVPHTLSLFDSYDKLWLRFQSLAYHYFQFRYYEEGKRKDRCKVKGLFRFDSDFIQMSVEQLPSNSKVIREDDRLLRMLQNYRAFHFDDNIRKACDILISNLNRNEIARVVVSRNPIEVSALQHAIAMKMTGDEREAAIILSEIRSLLEKDAIF